MYNEAKPFYLSRSIWAQLVVLLAQVLAGVNIPDLADYLANNPDAAISIAGGVQAVVAIAFRLVTKAPLR